ncbi:MAG: NTP transferase domain-containing protein, partial [Candidatus Xenobia bacterium]
MKLPAVVLAGGGLGKGLETMVQVSTKALIDIGGVPMAERVVRTLRQCPSVGRIVLVMQPDLVPEGLRSQVDGVAAPGEWLLDSQAN